MSIIATIARKKILWAVAGIIIIAAIIVMNGKKPVLVKVAELKPGELRVIVNATTTSTVKSETEVTLSAQRTGRVVKLPVKEGDIVKAGALIAQLDLTEESVQSESVLLQSKATFDEAKKNLERSQGLFDKGMIAQQDLDAVRRAYEVAQIPVQRGAGRRPSEEGLFHHSRPLRRRRVQEIHRGRRTLDAGKADCHDREPR